jgi:hypothetical protein
MYFGVQIGQFSAGTGRAMRPSAGLWVAWRNMRVHDGGLARKPADLTLEGRPPFGLASGSRY